MWLKDDLLGGVAVTNRLVELSKEGFRRPAKCCWSSVVSRVNYFGLVLLVIFAESQSKCTGSLPSYHHKATVSILPYCKKYDTMFSRFLYWEAGFF